MEEGAIAIGRHIDLTGVCLGVSNELRNGLGGHRWIDDHEKRGPVDASNRCDVAEKSKVEVVIERRVDRRRGVDCKQRITIRGRPHDGLGRDIGSGARPVLEYEWLIEALRTMLAEEARHNVGTRALRVSV